MKIPYARDVLVEAQKEVVAPTSTSPVTSGRSRLRLGKMGGRHRGFGARRDRRLAWGAYLGTEAIEKAYASRPPPTPHHNQRDMARAKMAGTYPNSILANLEATQHGYDEGLLLDVDGFVAEARRESLHRQDGKLHEPELTSALSGITRAS